MCLKPSYFSTLDIHKQRFIYLFLLNNALQGEHRMVLKMINIYSTTIGFCFNANIALHTKCP